MSRGFKKGQLPMPRGPQVAKPVKLSKRDVSEREINTAIELLVKGGDAVSIHVLSMAALHILEGVAKHKKLDTAWSRASLSFPDEYRQSYHETVNAAFNFMKHGGDAEALSPEFYEFSHWFMTVIAACTFHEIFEVPVSRMADLVRWLRVEVYDEEPELVSSLERLTL